MPDSKSMLLCERGFHSHTPTANHKVRDKPQIIPKKDGRTYLLVGTAKGPRRRLVTEAGWDRIRTWYPFDNYNNVADIPITYENLWELERFGEVIHTHRLKPCDECHVTLRRGARFCPHCGNDQTIASAPSAKMTTARTAAIKANVSRRLRYWRAFFLYQIVAIPILILIGITIWVQFRGETPFQSFERWGRPSLLLPKPVVAPASQGDAVDHYFEQLEKSKKP
jgi:hypothetical protein